MITLATLPQATAQQVYDQVKAHLLTQMKKSTTTKGLCQYRSKKDRRCAAGCLISDKEYDVRMENTTWDILVNRKQVPSVHNRLIRHLQLVHDRWPVSAWRAQLERVALKYNLIP